jgi:hypothetical protein
VSFKPARVGEFLTGLDTRHRSRQESFDYERAADEEAEAIAAERIRSGAADHREDGGEALERLGITVPLRGFEPRFPD